jgi:hypothetical protein
MTSVEYGILIFKMWATLILLGGGALNLIAIGWFIKNLWI